MIRCRQDILLGELDGHFQEREAAKQQIARYKNAG